VLEGADEISRAENQVAAENPSAEAHDPAFLDALTARLTREHGVQALVSVSTTETGKTAIQVLVAGKSFSLLPLDEP
jgi:hypothetical protein